MPSDNRARLLANLLIAQSGDEAWGHATRKMQQARQNKDLKTAQQWFEVLKALKDIAMQPAL